MSFTYHSVRLTCDECLKAQIDIPVEPAGEGGKTVEVPREYEGWKVTDARQICPACDQKLEGN
jgi:hypothetical protein